MSNVSKISFFVCTICALLFASENESSRIKLQSERHRTEWNWVEYRISITNVSHTSINNPIIRYVAENTNIQFCAEKPKESFCEGVKIGDVGVDSVLTAMVDYSTWPYNVKANVKSAGRYTIVDLKANGMLPPNKTIDVNVRFYRNDWKKWDCSRDFSYQKHSSVKEANENIAVYDGNYQILWGIDPVNGKNNVDAVVWNDRDKIYAINKFDGDDTKFIREGRFWVLKDSVFMKQEGDSLQNLGVKKLSSSRYLGKEILLLKAYRPVNVKKLQNVLSGFYNSFMVDDSTEIPLLLGKDDLYDSNRVCYADGSCNVEIKERSAYKLEVSCWADVPMYTCKKIVKTCGSTDAYIDRKVVIATIAKDSVGCLTKNIDVRDVKTEKNGATTGVVPFDNVKMFNGAAYDKMHLTELQNTAGWQSALKDVVKTTQWLDGEEYTGKGILVGVYDTGIDFSHPAFYEYDKNKGENVPRGSNNMIYNVTLFETEFHGTGVAGVIGGNGSGSPNSMFRGVAPKVNFYSDWTIWNNQRGNVVNHSHTLQEDDVVTDAADKSSYYYGKKTREVDGNIFSNWSEDSETGDNIVKTLVATAGNNGASAQYGSMMGYHSILTPLKNSITLGAIDALTNNVAGFSSMGPTWDGRIKPDLMAFGDWQTIVSTTPVGFNPEEYDLGKIEGYDYGYFAGTSCAAPVTSGVIALMYEKFSKRTGLPLSKKTMRNSTTKALLIHTAIDMEGQTVVANPDLVATTKVAHFTPFAKGPDFVTGWGRIDAKAALDVIENYNSSTGEFDKFREISVYDHHYVNSSRWKITVPSGLKKFRTTLVWDDAPPSEAAVSVTNFRESKLVNDLDMYVVSPSGKVYYPWRLDPLPTTAIDDKGKVMELDGIVNRASGLEKISLEEASFGAYNKCNPNETCPCFDRLNNVEVVDVETDAGEIQLEPGEWEIVVSGYRVSEGNSKDGLAQVATIVCDFKLHEKNCFDKQHPYSSNMYSSCVYDLGEGIENYVTFDSRTSLSSGDKIVLFDGLDRFLGSYKGTELAGVRVSVKSNTLKVILESDDDNRQGWGYDISKIEHLPYSVVPTFLQVPLKKKKKTTK